MKPIDMLTDGQHSRNIDARICNPLTGGCNKKVFIDEFKDEISLREYGISGLCQLCQDEVFMTEDDGDYFADPAEYGPGH